MHVLGTAGHVDHGKSSLVRALSGIDPDRLPEEKERGLTIDLGFAWFETEGGPLGVVDVPGHERFVRTMVAGAGGIDIVMLVVAADDGWMPQTQEHLEILRLLDVKTGVIALSKIDLVEESWVDLVEEDIRSKTAGTFLADAPIIRTDALSGKGIDELKTTLAEVQRNTSSDQDLGRARLAVDRVFTMTGQGTVVTGTLRDGTLADDQTVHIFPGNRPVRIRSLQTHRHQLKKARPGSRVAANLAGADRETLTRGHWLHAEEPVALPRYVGVDLEVLGGIPFSLKPRTELLVIFGTTEVTARLVLPTAKPLAAGSRAVALLDLREPLTARFGDRFIMRFPTPQVTVGGGRFLYPTERRYARKHTEAWQVLSDLATGDASDFIGARLALSPVEQKETLYAFFPGSRKEFDAMLRAGAESSAWRLEGKHLIQTAWFNSQAATIEESVLAYHKAHPSEPGPLSAELFSSGKIPAELHGAMLHVLEERGVRAVGPCFCHQSHRAGLTSAQERLAESWRARFAEQPFAGPTRTDLMTEGSEARPTLDFLLRSNELIELRDGILLRASEFERAAMMAVEALRRDGELTVATFRQLVATSRKYAVPILDRCDRLGYTRRVEDRRVLGPTADELTGGTGS
jgi:selenocysteine-specific elongation factor